LLGVVHDRLIASGQRLYWIGLNEAGQGRVQYVWPEGNQRLGYGRGVLAGGHVYWPTRNDIYVFQAASAQQERVIHLRPRGTGGGNLFFAAGRLLVAGPAELVALNVEGRAPPPNYRDVAHGGAGRESPHLVKPGKALCSKPTTSNPCNNSAKPTG
jgi:hypothetical protein